MAGHVAGQVAGDLKATLMKAGMSEQTPTSGARRLRTDVLSFSACTRAAGAPRISKRCWRKTVSGGSCIRSGMTECRSEKIRKRKRKTRWPSRRKPGRFTVGVFQDIPWAEKGVERSANRALSSSRCRLSARHHPRWRRSSSGRSVRRNRLRCTTLARCGAGTAGYRTAGQRSGAGEERYRRHDAARRIPGTRWPDFSCADRQRRGARGHSQRAAGGGCAGGLHSYGGGNAAIGAWTGRV